MTSTEGMNNRLRPVRPRVNRGYIHTDIFGFEYDNRDGNRVRNIPTFQSSVFDFDENSNNKHLRNIHCRPSDHDT
jgi:hypothetical protein